MKQYKFQNTMYNTLEEAVAATFTAETPAIDMKEIREQYRRGLWTCDECALWTADKTDREAWMKAAETWDRKHLYGALRQQFGITVHTDERPPQYSTIHDHTDY